jgi:hypothetical protein
VTQKARETAGKSGLWRHGDFLKLWAAQGVSAFGARISREGLPLAAILTIHADPAQLGVMVALTRGPSVIVGLLAGGFVDRSKQRSILVGADLFRAALLLTVPVAALFHHLLLVQLYAVAALVGGTSVLFDIADQAFLPNLVDRKLLLDANGKLALTDSVAELGGPALAGLLIRLFHAPTALAVNAVTYLVSALFLGTIRKVETAQAPDPDASPTHLGDLAQGLSAIMTEPVVRAIFFITLCQALFGGVFSALYLIFAVRALHLPPDLLGLTIAVGGVGSLLGAGAGPWLIRRFGIGPPALAAAMIGSASAVFIPLAHGSVAQGTAYLMASQLLGDSFATVGLIAMTSLRQSRLPPAMMGRAGAVLMASSGALAVIGALIGGFAGSGVGMRPALYVAVAGLVAAPLLGWLSPIRRVIGLEHPLDQDAPA